MIKFVIHGETYWDRTNGNSYYLTTITATNSRRSIQLYDSAPCNARALILNAGYDHSEILETSFGDISYRDWKRRIANLERYDRRVHEHEITGANIRGLVRRKK